MDQGSGTGLFLANLFPAQLVGLQVQKGGRMRDILIFLDLFFVVIMRLMRNLSGLVFYYENSFILCNDHKRIELLQEFQKKAQERGTFKFKE